MLINYVFIGIFAVALLGCVSISITRKNNNIWNDTTATLFAGIGILGTFVGIFIGLWKFNPANSTTITQSIPPLLEGLKTAFITSIIGLLISLSIKAYKNHINSSRKNIPDEDNVTGADIAELLIDIKNEIHNQPNSEYNQQLKLHELFNIIKDGNKTQEGQLKGIESAISSKLTTTMSTQLSSLQSTLSGKLDGLSKDFISFSQKMADNNTKALIEALNNVIIDFNTKINDQFGDNFKELNIAVGKLLDWQDKNKEHTQKLIEAFDVTSEQISIIKDSFIQITDRSDKLVTCAENLDPLLVKLQSDNEAISKHIQDFASISEKAQSVIPDLYKHIDNLTSNLENSIKEVVSDIRDVHQMSSSQIKDIVNTSQEHTSSLHNQMNEYLQNAISKQQELSNDQLTNLTNIKQHLSDSVKEVVSDIRDVHQMSSSQIKDIVNTSQEHTSSLHNQMNEYVQNAISKQQELSNDQLTNLTNIKQHLSDSVKEVVSDIQNVHQMSSSQIKDIVNASQEHTSSLQNQMNEYVQKAISKQQELNNDQLTNLTNIKQHLSDSVKEVVSDIQNVHQMSSSQIKDIVNTSQEHTSSLQNQMKDYFEKQLKILEKNNEVFHTDQQNSFNQLKDNFKVLIVDYSDTIKKQFDEFNRQYNNVYQKTLRDFGSMLSALSLKFAEDYTPITIKLKRIMDSLDPDGNKK